MNSQSDPDTAALSGYDLFNRIWDSALPQHLKQTLLAYAKHVNPTEGHVTRPSLERIGWLVGKSARAVSTDVKELETLGLLVPVGNRKGGATSPRFLIDVSALPTRDPWVSPSRREQVDQPEFAEFRKTFPLDILGEKSTSPLDIRGEKPTSSLDDRGEKWSAGGDEAHFIRTVRTELRTYEVPDQIDTEKEQEQQREKTRAATPEVVSVVGWGIRGPGAAFEAELATLPIPGAFASPTLARWWGYHIFDEQPDALFNDQVDRLMEKLHQLDVATSVQQCDQAMADVYQQRSMRDRTWDRAADRDRRAGRR